MGCSFGRRKTPATPYASNEHNYDAEVTPIGITAQGKVGRPWLPPCAFAR